VGDRALAASGRGLVSADPALRRAGGRLLTPSSGALRSN